MWRRIGVGAAISYLVFLHFAGRILPSAFWFWSPTILIVMLYFWISQDRFSSILVCAYFVFFIVIASIQAASLIFLPMIFVLLALANVLFMYRRNWERIVAVTEEKKKLVLGETELLRERYEARIGSLRHLEERVDGLVHLFEAARDLNECLDFSEMFSVLDQKIASQFNFSRGTVILLESEPGKLEKSISRLIFFGPGKREDDEVSSEFAGKCLDLLVSVNQTVRLDVTNAEEKKRFAPFATEFPLWLYPLSVERQLIAILAIEGASSDDFQKFEILASQLALQVKKIKLYETVKETSIVDGLTRVFVRRHFMERFAEELKRAFRYRFPLSVLMVDVDHFKSYNDQFGHLVGDKTLREVAQIIRDNVRRVDVIGRYGGEEFMVVAPEIDKKQASELAERIRQAVASKRFRLYDEETEVTVSIGISSFSSDLSAPELKEFSEGALTELTQKADQALYQAKAKGRNQIVAYGQESNP
jgi:diguanylate cyclase (GGDEF)-like protein